MVLSLSLAWPKFTCIFQMLILQTCSYKDFARKQIMLSTYAVEIRVNNRTRKLFVHSFTKKNTYTCFFCRQRNKIMLAAPFLKCVKDIGHTYCLYSWILLLWQCPISSEPRVPSYNVYSNSQISSHTLLCPLC